MITTLLIANRGEIALRVIRTARRLGIRTVAVYSDADRTAPHVRAADAAVRIGPASAADSYLDIDALIDAARRTGADAVHPGYGFLSERSDFARAVVEAGLVFVGPTADVIDAMGRKDAARELAIAAGVPVVPSAMAGEGGEVSFPVLVKAAAGGGGKGMRIVRKPEELDPAVAAARREAAKAFGDDTILLERYVERGRHVEVQVIADTHGTVLHLFERDCSVQRRHQKVIEEAPAPTISEDLRNRLASAAVALARQVGYTNAGTVEFLVDGEAFYFLEMNTRLQVEHPVTELVTGLDLVQLQLRVAAGEPVGLAQEEIRLRGHAIEARVYAEDAFGGFLPQAGTAGVVRWTSRARVDAALESGQQVTSAYDPMLGKVTVHAPTREAARRSLLGALDDSAILGLVTNLGFLRALADTDAFRTAAIDTAWLDRHTLPAPDDAVACLVAAWSIAHDPALRDASPFGAADGWRSAGPPAPVIVELARGGQNVVYRLQGESAETPAARHSVRHLGGEANLRLEIDGMVVEATVDVAAHRVEVSYQGHTFRIDRPDAFGPTATGQISDGSVSAPMPGTVLEVVVAEGQRVSEGELLGSMEAMKMELALKAPLDGVVTRVGCAPGDRVILGAPLFVVDALEDSES